MIGGWGAFFWGGRGWCFNGAFDGLTEAQTWAGHSAQSSHHAAHSKGHVLFISWFRLLIIAFLCVVFCVVRFCTFGAVPTSLFACVFCFVLSFV